MLATVPATNRLHASGQCTWLGHWHRMVTKLRHKLTNRLPRQSRIPQDSQMMEATICGRTLTIRPATQLDILWMSAPDNGYKF